MKTDNGYSLLWHRTNNDIVDHPKTGHLEQLLGDPNALAYITRLMAWTMRFCPRGRLAPFHGPSVENACRWRGPAGALLAAFVEAGQLDRTEDGGWEVHDWDQYQGAAVAKAEKDINRKQESRKNRASSIERAGRPTPRSPRDRGVGAGSARVDGDGDGDGDFSSSPPPPSSRDLGVHSSDGGRGVEASLSPQQPPVDRPLDVADAVAAWFRWAQDALGEHWEAPGDGTTAWAMSVELKYGQGALERMRPAYMDFLSWCSKTGRTPGWGLWIRDAVWEPRWADVRAGALPRQSGLGLGPINAVDGKRPEPRGGGYDLTLGKTRESA